MDEVVLAEMDTINFSPRWGSKWSTWGEVNEPKAKIQFYSPQAGNANITIKTEEGKELQQVSMEASRGVNVLNYDCAISEKGVKTLATSDLEIKKAENGKYYLPKGKYRVVLKLRDKSASTVFLIE